MAKKKLDPYETLGVDKTASKEAVKKAYRKRSMETHPDRGGSKEEFKAVKQSYLILSDASKRSKFDATGDADESEPDNAFSHSVGLVMSAFSAVLESAIRSGKDPAKEDFPSRIRQLLLTEKQSQADSLRTLDKAKAAHTRMLGRFKGASDTKSPFDVVLEMEILKIDEAKKGITDKMDAVGQALEFLNSIKYDREVSVEQLMGMIARVSSVEIGGVSTTKVVWE